MSDQKILGDWKLHDDACFCNDIHSYTDTVSYLLITELKLTKKTKCSLYIMHHCYWYSTLPLQFYNNLKKTTVSRLSDMKKCGYKHTNHLSSENSRLLAFW